MAKKTTAELLQDLDSEATEARSEMGSAKTGIRRVGEEAAVEEDESTTDDLESEEEDASQQDVENEEDQEDEPDEESDDAEDDTEEEVAEDPRERNREAAARRVQAKKDEQIAELQAKIHEYETARTESERKSLEEEIGPLAEELKLDVKGLTRIMEKSLELAERRFSDKLPSKEIMEDYENRQENTYFESEWKSFFPTIASEYPKMSATQLEQAKDLMDNLSHDEEYGGVKITGKDGKPRLQPYPLDYIMFRNKDQFDKILSPSRRRGLESASTTIYDVDSDEQPDMSTARGIDKMDKIYANIAADSSGLRRGRSPKNRSI